MSDDLRVCYRDGWHSLVETDAADKARRVALAQAAVKHAPTDEARAAAESELAEVEAHPHDVPGQRLVLEDRFVTADGETYEGSAVFDGEAISTPEGDALSVEARYRLATDADTSWAKRKHRRFVSIDLEGGSAGISVTPEELEVIKKMLADKRGQ